MIDLKLRRLMRRWKKLLSQIDLQQGRALSNVAVFFAIMVVLTIIVRGTSNVTMPFVTATAPYQGIVSQSFQAQGVISLEDGEPFVLPANLLTKNVSVVEGGKVQIGTEIATFFPDQVDQMIAEQKAKLSQIQVEASQLASIENADPASVEQSQRTLNRAYDNYNKTQADNERAIAKSQSKYDMAQQIVNELLGQQPAKPEVSDPSIPLTPEQEQAEKIYKEWLQRLETAKAELSQAESALASAKSVADSQLQSALTVAQNAEDGRNSALHNYDKEQQTFNKSNATNAASSKVLQTQIAAVTKTLSLLDKIQADGYRYLASSDGIITDLRLMPGEHTTDVGGLSSNPNNGFSFVAQLDKEYASIVSTGMVIEISQGQNTQQAVISTIAEAENNIDVSITVDLQSENWSVGMATAFFEIQGNKAGLCLPSTAIHTDNQGEFVYLIEEKNTVLGIQNVLVRLPITVEERGDTTVCVSGALSQETRIATISSKPLSAGAKVRIDE